jgi:predicted nucleic acid-binding protein
MHIATHARSEGLKLVTNNQRFNWDLTPINELRRSP